jgi:hypothetical protein
LGGLYERALEVKRQRPHLRLVRPEEFGGEQSSAEEISSEEREQILEHINKFVEQNRLEIKPETFSFTPKQSGLLMPFLINISAILIFVAGFFLFSHIFDQRQESIVSETKALLTAEGKLIEALKKESQEKISQKDRQIQEIQGRLAEINSERDQLKRDSDAAIREREQVLREALERELEQERQRLQATGVSEQVMAQRLRELEEKRGKEYEQQIAAFKIEMEAELAEKDAAIASLASEYQKFLEQAREERIRLQAEMEKRQAQLQEKERSLETDRARMLEELSRLRDQQKSESLVLDQILSSYDRTTGLIRGSQYDEALLNLKALRAFLEQDSIASLPIVQRRRSVELFIIGSLEELIHKIYLQGSHDTSSLIASTNLLSQIASVVDEADLRFGAGDVSGAEQLYREALRKIAAIWSSYSKLDEIEQLSLEQERKKLDALIAEADSLYQAEEFRSSVDRYTQALKYLKEDAAAAKRIVERIMDCGYRLLPDRDSTTAAEAGETTGGAGTKGAAPALLGRLAKLRRDYESYLAKNSGSSESSPQTLTKLLEAKILVMQIIAAEPVKSEYPELYDTMERYFDAFGEERIRDGQSEALKDVIAVLESLTGDSEQEESNALWKSYNGEERALLLQLLSKLQALFRLSDVDSQ